MRLTSVHGKASKNSAGIDIGFVLSVFGTGANIVSE
jgi:hypothetical protein